MESKAVDLNGKVAIVTGASRGIGKTIAIELASAGASVVVAARTVEAGQSSLPGTIQETVRAIEKAGGRSLPVRCDVTNEEDVIEMVRLVTEKFGRVDILINNAGITTPEPFLKLSSKKWDLVMGVNLRGTFLCTRAVLPQMVERRSGHIVNLSSVLAKTVKYSVVYGASKAAIERFTLGLAREMRKHHVAVYALRPDFTVTEAVDAFLKGVDTSDWQTPEMWGRYASILVAQDFKSVSGQIFDETKLRKMFGPLD